MKRFTAIPDQRRTPQMPRVAKIRLGVKKKAGSGRDYPSEVDYFVLSDCPEVAKVYGDAPKALPVLFPLEPTEAIIPHRYAYWGSDAGLKCQGDGREAMRVNPQTREMEECECLGPAECDFACTKGDGSKVNKPLCIRQGTLSFMLPAVSMAGVYQIDTTSWHSIQGILDDLMYIRTLCGRVSLLTIANKPLIYLVRRPKDTHGSGHKEVHFPMHLELRASQEDIWAVRKRATERALTTGAASTAIVRPEQIPPPTAPEDLLPAGHFEPADQPDRRLTPRPPKPIKSVPVTNPDDMKHRSDGYRDEPESLPGPDELEPTPPETMEAETQTPPPAAGTSAVGLDDL